MRLLYPDIPTARLADLLSTSVPSVYAKAQGLGLRKSASYLSSPAACRLRRGGSVGASNRFKPGHRPHNAGVKGWQAGGKAVNTQFKPGCRLGRAAVIYQPIGAERISKDGYLQRKVNDDMPLQRRWRGIHQLLWEEHYGPIPRGHAVVFRNGDRSDVRIENLELISRAELMRRNMIHNLPKELANVCQLKGVLQRQINRMRRNGQKQD